MIKTENNQEETVIISGTGKLPLKGWLVQLDSKGIAEKSFELNQASQSIGRDSCNDIVLDDPTVSRIHCYVRISGEEIYILEEDPVNGIFVDEYPFSRALIKDGTQVRLGRTVLMVKLL